MVKRQTWITQQDQCVAMIISSFQAQNIQLKWSQIAIALKKQNPNFCRTGKQCRQRWLNHLRPSVGNAEQIFSKDIQKFFEIYRAYGKKWSLIAKQFPGRTYSSIKNFFYTALRRGLRNLNLYNTKIRKPKRYKSYSFDLLDKIISIHDENKSKDLFIMDQSAYQLAQNLREILIKSSIKDTKQKMIQSIQSDDLFYEDLNQKATLFGKICKYKKARSHKQRQKNEKYEVFTRRTKPNKVRAEQIPNTDQEKRNLTEEKQLKIEENLDNIALKQLNFADLLPCKQEIKEQYYEILPQLPEQMLINYEMSFGHELMPFGTHINFYDMLGNYEVKTDQDFVCQY